MPQVWKEFVAGMPKEWKEDKFFTDHSPIVMSMRYGQNERIAVRTGLEAEGSERRERVRNDPLLRLYIYWWSCRRVRPGHRDRK